jgi:hypothetical protein
MNDKKKKEILRKIHANEVNNISYVDFCNFVECYGFQKKRQNGTSHTIYGMADIPEIVNIQNNNGNAKGYQVREFGKLIEKYKLGGEEFDS